MQKGCDILIDAFRTRPKADAELHIYGAGAELDALRARAAGATNIVFKGFASDVAAAMAACDVVALPSRWEAYGIVAIEAMAAGRPVLASRVDGLASHAAGGAVYVGENTPGGWSALLERVGSLDLADLAAKGRRHGAEPSGVRLPRFCNLRVENVFAG